MNCQSAESELVTYHFGTISEEVRHGLEEHFLRCGQCLRSYLALKREIETAADSGEVPSSASRKRLRLAVAKELRGSRIQTPWRGWERAVALGVATVAIWVAVLVTHSVAVGPGAAPRTLASRLSEPRD